MLTWRNRRLPALVAAVALTLTACGGDDGAEVRDLGAADETSVSASASGSGSASGSASASGSGSASAPASSGDSATTTGDGGYEYASNVDAHRLVVADLCPIGDLLDGGDFAEVEAIYRDGVNSVNSDGSVRSIGGFAASEDRSHGLDAYYGTPTPLDDFITEALTGTGRFEGQSDGVRSQGAEKGIRNQAMVAWVIHELNAALAKAADGDFDVAEGAVHNWDEGWAFYHGSQPGCAPWATGNSRAGNFGTLAADGETALANERILQAMIDGRDALLAEDAAGAEAAAADAVAGLAIIYSQATVRYAALIEGDLAEGDDEAAKEHQAEGLAFWRVMEATLADNGADVDVINAIFDLGNEPGVNGFGDEVRAALAPAWSALGITDADIGELE